MKTFKDLDFQPHKADLTGTQARIDFRNGYGASVVTGELAYTSDAAPYELAVFKGDKLTFDTPITDDVLGDLTAEEVTKLLAKIQKLS